MISRLLVIALFCCSLILPIYGMENSKIIQQLIYPEKYPAALFQFIGDDKILLNQTQALSIPVKKQLSSIIYLKNLFTPAEIIHFKILRQHSIVQGNQILHFNNQHIQIDSYDGEKVTNEKLIHFNNSQTLLDCKFGTDKNTLILLFQNGFNGVKKLQTYDYETGSFLENNKVDDCIKFTHNPINKTICILRENILDTYNSSNLKKLSSLRLNYNHYCPQLSANNQLAAIGKSQQIVSLIDCTTNTTQLIKPENEEKFYSTCFNANGSVLATVSLQKIPSKNLVLKYWDTNNTSLIKAQLDFLEVFNIFDIKFSPKGDMLAIATAKNLTFYCVPWKVQYQTGIKQKFLLILSTLNRAFTQHFNQHYEWIPHEVINSIKFMCLECCKR